MFFLLLFLSFARSVMVGYFVGLSVTLFIMYQFNHAQPALLYLVPACNLAVFLCAAVRGEIGVWFNFDESPPAAVAIVEVTAFVGANDSASTSPVSAVEASAASAIEAAVEAAATSTTKRATTTKTVAKSPRRAASPGVKKTK